MLAFTLHSDNALSHQEFDFFTLLWSCLGYSDYDFEDFETEWLTAVVATVSNEGFAYFPAYDPDNPGGNKSNDQSSNWTHTTTEDVLQFYYQQCRRCALGTFSNNGAGCIPCPAHATCVQSSLSKDNDSSLLVTVSSYGGTSTNAPFTRTSQQQYTGTAQPKYIPGFWTAASTDSELRNSTLNVGRACAFPFSVRCPGGVGDGNNCGSTYLDGSFMCGTCNVKSSDNNFTASVQFEGQCWSCESLYTFPAVNLWWMIIVIAVTICSVRASADAIRESDNFGNVALEIRCCCFVQNRMCMNPQIDAKDNIQIIRDVWQTSNNIRICIKKRSLSKMCIYLPLLHSKKPYRSWAQ